MVRDERDAGDLNPSVEISRKFKAVERLFKVLVTSYLAAVEFIHFYE